MLSIILLVLGSLFLVACSTTPPINTPINIKPIATETKIPSSVKKIDDTLVVLTFSGGGARSAAFSYGVLKGLSEIYITPQKTLLDEVDIISSVSGGSFTAAYYGLFGNRIFKDYKQNFLKRSVKSEFIGQWMLSPRNLRRMSNRQFNRSDLLAEYYDEKLYLGKTFADMQANMPTIIINTTDISTGQPFAFTKQNMQWICSNLADYPVSRAVAASSAVPGALTPVKLKNYAGCNEHNKSSKNVRAKIFQDKNRYPNLHLVDGGISDNLGIRSVLDAKMMQQQLQHAKEKGIRQVIFIIVNAAGAISPNVAHSTELPKLYDVVRAATTIQLQRYNQETLSLLNRQIQKWRKQYNNCHKSKRCRIMHFHQVVLNFRQLPKPLADKVLMYKTSLDLEDEQIDTLINAGKYLLTNNQQILDIVRALSGKAAQRSKTSTIRQKTLPKN